jgi:hypothetical protein
MRRRKREEAVYVVAPPRCCWGHGYVELVDLDYEPYDFVACWCAAGKKWAAKKGSQPKVTPALEIVPEGHRVGSRA